MQKPVLNRAKSLGFPSELNAENNWQISPNKPEATWQLIEVDSRWLLNINNISQIYLDSEEVISFLARRKTCPGNGLKQSFERQKSINT